MSASAHLSQRAPSTVSRACTGVFAIRGPGVAGDWALMFTVRRIRAKQQMLFYRTPGSLSCGQRLSNSFKNDTHSSATYHELHSSSSGPRGAGRAAKGKIATGKQINSGSR
ncbi:unnamed protein product [Pleuronectes platessa]|uniref:Uncharacterized protein n=1 Tax=Pleuronectes platessa TaxID=8262 RepID=A0A9N7YF09_PLEPL|nr:unnamed protein product [Pleuronectes platessa]